MKVVALTGGIGSGKSTAVAMFAQLGVPILDLDQVGHGLLEDSNIKQELSSIFGQGILSSAGEIDRKALAKKAFASAAHTASLNKVMHPAIALKEQIWLSQQDAPYVLIEASVLLESGSYKRMDAVIVVLADQALRCSRALARGLQTKTMFEIICSRQCDDALRQELADYTLNNTHDFESLQKQVGSLHGHLMERCR
ncbi:MAG: dephospho-CoA kinase [Mariprofundaceae bacterium]